MPHLRILELMRLGVRMLPRTVSRLASLTRLAFSGEMMRSVQLQDDLLQLTDLKVRQGHPAHTGAQRGVWQLCGRDVVAVHTDSSSHHKQVF